MAARRPIGWWISLAAGVSLVAVVGAHALSRGASSPVSAKIPTVSAPSPADRIWFAENQAQQLRLANGSARTVRSMLQVPARMQFGEFLWNDRDVPPGPVWLRVDLARQIVSVFRGGDEIGTSVILYGQDATPTPLGNFPIRALERNHRSNNYDAEMPYTLWLTGDGVAIHGSDVRAGLATHGCIGVPLGFAKQLFAIVKPGDLVAVVR